MTRIAYLGQPGSYSDLACRTAFPGEETIGCVSFPEVFAAASDGRAGLAMIPVDNSLAGRIADVHHLLPESDLHIVGEHFQRIEHHLLAPKARRSRPSRRSRATSSRSASAGATCRRWATRRW